MSFELEVVATKLKDIAQANRNALDALATERDRYKDEAEANRRQVQQLLHDGQQAIAKIEAKHQREIAELKSSHEKAIRALAQDSKK